MNPEVENLWRRANRLPSGAVDRNLRELIEKLHFMPLETAIEFASDELDQLELQQNASDCPFIPPNSDLGDDRILIGHTVLGEPVRITLSHEKEVHLGLIGPTGSGKTVAGASIAEQARGRLNVAIIEHTGSFSQIRSIRENFAFISLRNDIKRNPFDIPAIPGLARQEWIQRALRTFAKSYELQWALRLGLQVAEDVGEKGELCPHTLREHVAKLRFRPGSNQLRYAESLLLALDFALKGNSPSLDCRTGHDHRTILNHGAIVLSTSGLTIDHAAWRTADLLDFMEMIGRHYPLEKRLLLIIDDSHDLLSHEAADLDSRLLTLRHHQVHCCLCIQSVSLIPRHVLANLAAIIVFPGIVDQRDRRYIAESLNLTPAQSDWLAAPRSSGLTHEALCFIPRKHPSAFVIHLPHLDVDARPEQVECPQFIRDLAWTPLGAQRPAEDDTLDPDARALLQDVTTFEFSTQSERFTRLRINSTSRQIRLVRMLQEKNLAIAYHAVTADGRCVLLGPTRAAFELFGMTQPKKEGGGASLLHRFYAVNLRDLLHKMAGWTARLERILNGHVVDVLAQNEDRIFSFDVMTSVPPDHEVRSALIILEGPRPVAKHHIVCSTKEQTRKMQQVVKKYIQQGLFEEEAEKVEVIQFAKLQARLKNQILAR